MTIWDNLKKTEVNTLVKFHNEHPGESSKVVKLTFARLLSLARVLRTNGHDAKTRRERLQWVISKCSK